MGVPRAEIARGRAPSFGWRGCASSGEDCPGPFRSNACRRIGRLPGLTELDGLIVVLVRPRNPLNIGAVARAMSNFGTHHLRLVNPYAVAFREARSAVGASDLLKSAEEFKSVADAVADCTLVIGTTAVRNRALSHLLRRLDPETGQTIREQLRRGRVALLFGSEKIGLTNDDFSHCHWLLNIPTEANHISMNLAQAVAVCLYEIAHGETVLPEIAAPSTATTGAATAGEAEQITETLLEALHKSGYVKPGNDAVSEKKVRSLILRLNMSAGDANVLLGMVRQIVWKLRRAEKDKE
jgi:TrmH family RNA methyltransferase